MTFITRLVQLPHLPDFGAHKDIFFGTRAEVAAHPQLYERFPSLKFAYFPFETNFLNASYLSRWFNENMWLPLVISATYVALCFIGIAILKDRKEFGFRKPLAYWNLICAIFSFFCAIRTVPQLALTLYDRGFYPTVCGDAWLEYGTGASGLWTFLFIVSKTPELIDTAFIVLRKRPLIFLHWYHHCTVLLFCWHSYATRSGSGLWFVTMNSTVHSIMYYYFYLAAIMPKDKKPKWDWIVTFAQIAQMIVGIVICLMTYVYWSEGKDCLVNRENWVWSFLMYLSYLVLFLHFAFGRYCGVKPKRSKEPKTGKKEAEKEE